MSSWVDLLAACQRGDAEAWSDMVQRLAGLARHSARRAGIDEALLDDAVQDVFLTLYRQLPGIRDPQALPAWVMTTARRQAKRHRRPRSPAASAPHAPVGEPIDDPGALLQRWEETDRIRGALEALGGRCATLLTELYRSGARPDYADIARRLEMPVGSIGPTRARCLARLLDLVEHPRDPQSDVSAARDETPVPRVREDSP